MRRVRARAAHAALARAEEAARWARIPALAAEVEQALAVLDTPAARLVARGGERPLLLEEVEALFRRASRRWNTIDRQHRTQRVLERQHAGFQPIQRYRSAGRIGGRDVAANIVADVGGGAGP
jgi:hypothetical protein